MSATSGAITVIANQAPSANLTAPAANTVLTAPASFTLSATADDIDGGVTQVEFYANDILLGTATTAPYSYTWNNVPAGTIHSGVRSR